MVKYGNAFVTYCATQNPRLPAATLKFRVDENNVLALILERKEL